MTIKMLYRAVNTEIFAKYTILIGIFMLICNISSYAQFSAVKFNLLGLATTNINASIDLQVNKKTTINIPVSYNPFSFGRTQFKHIAIQPGVRLWKYENYIGPFVGIYATAAQYQSSYKHSYADGYLGGVGASYGYSILMSTRWSLEFEVGMSIIYTEYDLRDHDIGVFDDEIVARHHKIGVYPSKACISFSYIF